MIIRKDGSARILRNGDETGEWMAQSAPSFRA
jgi:hypothetical protein